MTKIKNGYIFLYKVEDKIGLIQIINKTSVGYNVRVFYDLINTYEEINDILNSDRYYFIKNFYTFDLLKANDILSCKINKSIKMPILMRTCEWNKNDKLIWYVINVKKRKVIKQYDIYHEELKDLSPEETWGIEYIIRLWKENFTLKNWNDLSIKWFTNWKTEVISNENI